MSIVARGQLERPEIRIGSEPSMQPRGTENKEIKMRIGAIGLTLSFAMGFAFLIVAGVPPVSDAGPCDDSDNDGICLEDDTCSDEDESTNTDVDGDGYGNACDFDYDNNCLQNLDDFTAFRGDFLVAANSNMDCNQDGLTNLDDFTCFRGGFLNPLGPTGVLIRTTTPSPGRRSGLESSAKR